ncbi:MAG TPA: fumarylacetoacetate hydrolase family protein [Alphaproteobacteria bacterium]|nr:fumarylacetoacetate hydrolase family protein [Alphaproteobacteria bacterium]
MKLLRYGPKGKEKPGILDADGRLRSLGRKIADIGPETMTPAALAKLRKLDPRKLPPVAGKPRLGVPLASIGKLVCVGLNYSDHARESGLPIPTEPILFMKANTSIGGPNDRIAIPRGSVKTDWEVELGVVIGRKARYVEEAKALSYVAGYCVINDVSERQDQIERLGQWVKGKSHDGFGPIGPWIVTANEVKDPQALDMWLDVNGQRMQSGSTRTMIFSVAYLVAYISRFMTLEPGDVISTGTPPGVGLGRKPPLYLKAGDVVTLGIAGLGQQRQVYS